MRRRGWTSRWARRLLASVVGVALAGTLTAHAQARPDPVTGWVRHHAAEELTLKHRTLRLLVEDMGFRSVAWEEDWTTGLQIDRYIRTGRGDLDALMAQMSPQRQSREVAQVLAWLRDYNTGRADKVRFVGVEYYLLRALTYDAVEAHVARTAPQRLAELRRHLRVIRPDTADMFAYIQWYLAVADKAPYLDHARRVYRLVKSLPHRPGDRAHALALHHARQIVSFYEHYSLPQPPASDSLVYRDAHAAQNLRWWHRYNGGKVAYWGASAHTANAPRLRIFVPPGPDWRYATAGSHLRRWYGRRYVSIGFTFDHGAVSLGPEGTATLPPPAPAWFERPFGKVGLDQFALDLHTAAPAPVRRWLQAPIRTRGLRCRSRLVHGRRLPGPVVRRDRPSPGAHPDPADLIPAVLHLDGSPPAGCWPPRRARRRSIPSRRGRRPSYRKGVVSETKEQPMDNKDGYFDEQTAERYDELSADMFQPAAVDPVVEVLAKLAGGGRALELGIGTGRIALPLAARGVPVHGIELSRAMAAQLRAKPGGEAIGVTIGDFATTRVEGRFSVAYLVFNTIMNLTTQEAQVACFRNVAAHLEPGGCFVIEQRVPELRRLPAGGNVLPWQMGPDRWVLYSYDVATQAMRGHYVEFTDGRGEYSTIPFRYVWPAELDLMAQLAGLRLRDRWSGWTGEAFTSDSPKHVSIWEKPARST